MKRFNGKKVLVTGAAGFMGSHVVRALLREGAQVIGLVRPRSDDWRLRDLETAIGWVRYECGGGGLHKFEKGLQDIDIVYHLAAMSHNHPAERGTALVRSNVLGTMEFLEWAKKIGVKRFVYCGSCFEYPSGRDLKEDTFPMPLTEYAASKTAGWLLANAFYRRYQLPVVTLRAFTVYGPYEAPHRMIPYTINRALKGETVEMTAGEQTRDFVYIDDMTEAFLKAGVQKGLEGETFNICTGQDIAMKDLVPKIIKKVGAPVDFKLGVKKMRDVELLRLSGDPTKAIRKMHWTAKSDLENGLEKTITWFRENRSQFSVYG